MAHRFPDSPFSPNGSEVKLSPLFIETSVSLLSGLFMLIWGFLFLSNPLYQLSQFTKARNVFISEEMFENDLQGIYIIGVDPKSILDHDNEGEITLYNMISSGLESIVQYALNHPEKRRIVVGVDYLFLKGNKNETERLAQAVARMPDNVILIFGMSPIPSSNSELTALEPAYVAQNIIPRAKEIRENFLESNMNHRERYTVEVEYQCLFGNLPVSKGTIRSGLDEEMTEAIIGNDYIINIQNPDDTIYPSLAFAMYYCGEVLPEKKVSGNRWLIASDALGGYLNLGDNPDDFYQSMEGGKYTADELTGFHYFNIRSHENIPSFASHYFWLSRIANKKSPDIITEESVYGKNVFDSPLYKFETSRDRESTNYFFIIPTEQPSYLDSLVDSKDIVITPASRQNPDNYEYETVYGGAAHIHGLINLKKGDLIRNDRFLHWYITVFSTVLLYLLTRKRSLKLSISITLAALSAIILLIFAIFCLLNVFIPLKLILISNIFLFALTTAVKYYHGALGKSEAESVLMSIYTPSFRQKYVKVGQTQKMIPRKPKIYSNVLTLGLKIKASENFAAANPEDAYTSGIETLVNVRETLNRFHGGIGYLDSNKLIFFWNIPPIQSDIDSLKEAQEAVNALTFSLSQNRKNVMSLDYRILLSIDSVLFTGSENICESRQPLTGSYLEYLEKVNYSVSQKLVIRRGLIETCKEIMDAGFLNGFRDPYIIKEENDE